MKTEQKCGNKRKIKFSNKDGEARQEHTNGREDYSLLKKIKYKPICHCPFSRPRKGRTEKFSVALEWDIGPYARNGENEEGGGGWGAIRR
jgi:hypothetical protein